MHIFVVLRKNSKVLYGMGDYDAALPRNVRGKDEPEISKRNQEKAGNLSTRYS